MCLEILNKISPKYYPNSVENPIEEVAVVTNEPDAPGRLRFYKNTTIRSLDEGFLIFGTSKTNSRLPITPGSLPPDTTEDDQPTVIVYTDGSCESNGTLEARAGAGTWYYAQDDVRNKAIRLPDDLDQSNNTGELVAILTAAVDTPSNHTLEIRTDSQYAIDNLITHRARHEDGWINTSNREISKKIIAVLRQRNGTTFLKKVKGHSGDQGNDGADQMANIGARKEVSDVVDLTIPPTFQLEGAQLIGLNQAQLYRGIRECKEKNLTPRRAAVISLDITRWAAKEQWEILPTDAAIWNSIRNNNIDRKIRAFLYKALHATHRIGTYWDKIPNYEHRSRCTTCSGVEDLEHILTVCPNYGQETVWALVRDILALKGIDIQDARIGNILSAPLASFKLPGGKPNAPLNRFYTIIMTESMYLIWLLTCEWRIEHNGDPAKLHSTQEITSKWPYRINRRLRIDQTMASKNTHKWKKVTKKLVLKTWNGTLNNEAELPEDWIGRRGVLVSSSVGGRPPGRNR